MFRKICNLLSSFVYSHFSMSFKLVWKIRDAWKSWNKVKKLNSGNSCFVHRSWLTLRYLTEFYIYSTKIFRLTFQKICTLLSSFVYSHFSTSFKLVWKMKHVEILKKGKKIKFYQFLSNSFRWRNKKGSTSGNRLRYLAMLKIDGARVVEMIAGINDVTRIPTPPPAIKIGCGETHR